MSTEAVTPTALEWRDTKRYAWILGAVFVVIEVASRPLGGALADRFPGAWVLIVSYTVTGLMAAAATERLPLVSADAGTFYPVGTAVFLFMAASLGTASVPKYSLYQATLRGKIPGSSAGRSIPVRSLNPSRTPARVSSASPMRIPSW